MSEYDILEDPAYRIFLQAWHGWTDEVTDHVMTSLRYTRDQWGRLLGPSVAQTDEKASDDKG